MIRHFLKRWLAPKARRSKYHLRRFLAGCIFLGAGMVGMVFTERLMASSVEQELIALGCHGVALLGLLYGLAHYLALLGGRLYRFFKARPR